MCGKRGTGEGQSLVELALLLPVLLLILAAALDLGRAFQAHIVVINAAREGARYASLYPDDPQAIRNQVINEAAASNIDLSSSAVVIEIGAPGEPVTVTVTYQFQPITGLILGGQPIPISGSATMIRF